MELYQAIGTEIYYGIADMRQEFAEGQTKKQVSILKLQLTAQRPMRTSFIPTSIIPNFFLNKAEKLYPGNRLTKQIKELNAKNVSFLQYNREHTGVDSNNDPNAKDLE